jgi:hypothetical protein
LIDAKLTRYSVRKKVEGKQRRNQLARAIFVFVLFVTKKKRMSDDQDGYIDRHREKNPEKNLVSARFFLISVVHGLNLILLLLLFNATHNLFLIVYK